MPFSGLKPKEEQFFKMLMDHAELCVDAAELMVDGVCGKIAREVALAKVDKLEKDADEIVAITEKKLHKTFITPMDREDIHVLIELQDDIMDSTKEILEKLHVYNAGTSPEGVVEMAKNLLDCVKQVSKAIKEVPNVKKNYLKIEARTNKIKQFEKLGDELYRDEMMKLFRETTDAIEIIKWKEILSELEKVFNVCESLADSLKRVVLKYA